MAFGLSMNGLEVKRLADIKPEIEGVLRQRLGNSINLLPETVFGQIVGIFSDREAEIWELVEDVYHSQFPDDAEGASLDNAVAFTGIKRLEATKSLQKNQILFGTTGTLIPINTQLSVNGNPNSKFKTKNSITLVSGQNAIQIITFGNVPNAGSFTLKFKGLETALILSSATASLVQSALNTLSNLSGVVVTGSFTLGFLITFASDDGLQVQPLLSAGSNTLNNSSVPTALSISQTQFGVPQGQVDLEALDFGPVDAPVGTLTVIDTPVAGLTRVTNNEPTIIGRNRETDTELKSRREETLSIGGNSTIEAIRAKLKNLEGVLDAYIFENETLLSDLAGRPGKSYECVVDGGNLDVIANTVWRSKPGGIQTVGTINQNIIDSQGVTRTVHFSRPTPVPIFISLDLTVNLALFPQSGAQKVKDLIVAWGSALGIGANVVVYPQLIAQLATVLGILDVRVRINTSAVSNTPNAPAVDDNIIIQPFQVASFAAINTGVNVL